MKRGDDKLGRYNEMRDFGLTEEPSGVLHTSETGRSFVVQKHDATRLHYDFRLEHEGVLWSWAVPKGPSLSPKEKRLAVQTEDHPVDYRDFEGTIPHGEYGGGPVIVWDRGTWEPKGNPAEGMKKGRIEFSLRGQKLHGAFILVRLAPKERDRGKSNWLLMKRSDEHVREGDDAEIVKKLPRSVITDRTVEDVGRGVPASPPKTKAKVTAKAKAKTKRAAKTTTKRATKKHAASASKGVPLPSFGAVQPQLATLVDDVPTGSDWIYELKYDGYRAIATLDHGEVRIASRNGKDWTDHFGPVAEALAHVRAQTAVFDGEVAYVQDDGRTDFQKLQNALGTGHHDGRIVYFVFDLLHYDGVDLTELPLLERKDRLRTILAGEGPPLRMGDHVAANGEAFFQEACKLGLEGIIAKRADRGYASGRGKDWVKVKCQKRQELVIVGFTPPKGTRQGIGALLLGVRDGEGGKTAKYRYAGKVGTGFSQASLAELAKKLEPLIVDAPTVVDPPRMREAVWATPKLVCQVRFTEWTTGGALRHPAFEGLRDDKKPQTVIREEEKSLPKRASTNGALVVGSTKITHPERVMDRSTGITKGDIARYAEVMAPYLLPFAKKRPLMLVRCTDAWSEGPIPLQGRGRPKKSACFVQKHAGRGLVDFPRDKVEDEEVIYLTKGSDVHVLAQAGVVEIHGWGSRMPKYDRPDWIVFDLDPDVGLPFTRVVEAAQHMRDELGGIGLTSFVKTTGGKGLHVVVPLTPKDDWEIVKAFSGGVAEAFAKRAPRQYVATMTKAARTGKIFVDYFRNGQGATAVLPYSARARPGAPVAMPVAWEDLPAIDPADFTVLTVPAVLDKRRTDPWEELLTTEQVLPREVVNAMRGRAR